MNVMTNLPEIDPQQRTEIEAATYRKMIEHFRKYPEVQNIQLMNLAYFCRNCFAKWYRKAAAEQGVEMDYEQAREIIYGMPYAEYKNTHLQPASDEELTQFEKVKDKASE